MAFCPPVSAISGIGRPVGDSRSASCAWISRATSVEPVNITPAVSGAPTSAAPTAPVAGHELQRRRAGRRPRAGSATLSAAISGVSSAGLASTGLPATSAAATWPVKIASGKFHGLMQTIGPERRVRRPERPARLVGVVAQEIDRLAHLGDGVRQPTCRPRAR